MANSTSITYRLKRKILSFTNKISLSLSKPDRKFTADMVYGILSSKSCLLTDISDQLHESSRKAKYRKTTFKPPRGGNSCIGSCFLSPHREKARPIRTSSPHR